MTNYVTKGDASSYQFLTVAQSLRKRLEDNQTEGAGDVTIDLDRFALRAFNQVDGKREVSGPAAAAWILDLPSCYTMK